MLKNVPAYAKDYEAIIATRVEKDHWFYGAYSLSRANEIAYKMRREEGRDVSVFLTKDIYKKPDENELEKIRTLGDWLRVNHELKTKGFYLDSFKKEMLENELRFIEAMSID